MKNKREIWIAEQKVNKMREKAKKLIRSTPEEQKKLFNQLQKIGLEVNSIGDVLALNKEDYLKRRLQSVVVKKGLATTVKGARQLITHKKVMVDGKVVNIPSYIVPVTLESKLTLKKKVKKPKVEEKKEEAPVEEATTEESTPEVEVKEEEKENA